jgi:putative hydrolase of the HAD superfamily
MIQAVIFDLGGTLVEYAGEYLSWPELETPGFKAAHLFFQEEGLPLPEFAHFHARGSELLPGRWQRATAGEQNLTVVDLLAELLAQSGIDSPGAAVMMAAADRYQAAVQAQAYPVPSAQKTLARLKADGYRLGLISNTMFSSKAHLADLARFNMAGYFDKVLFSAEENKWKPNPAPFEHILLAFDLPPAAAVFVGDDPANDVLGAQRAGLRAVHFRSTNRFPQRADIRPDATIDDLGELPALLLEMSNLAR